MIEWLLDMRTVSEANCSAHWTVKHKRHKNQKRIIWTKWNQIKPRILLPCNIELTRISPRTLDKEENLPMSLKWVKDTIADLLRPGLAPGRADDSCEMIWHYGQEKGKKQQVRIRIWNERRID